MEFSLKILKLWTAQKIIFHIVLLEALEEVLPYLNPDKKIFVNKTKILITFQHVPTI